MGEALRPEERPFLLHVPFGLRRVRPAFIS